MQLIKRLFGQKKQSSTAAANLPEAAQLASPTLTPEAWLLQLFERHELPSTVHDGWVLPNSELPAVRATWHAGETHGRLDVQVLVRDGLVIEECFAGIGAGDIGLADGLQNFTINSFHTLLSALWLRHDPEQVETETWCVAGRQFSAFNGNIGTRSSTGVTPSIPAGMMRVLEAAIRGEPLEQDLHWFRFYVGQMNGEFSFEALKDNEPWPAGVSALASCGWAPRDGFYSARLFIVLREKNDADQRKFLLSDFNSACDAVLPAEYGLAQNRSMNPILSSIEAGRVVRVLAVESCASELPAEDQERLKSMIGSLRSVARIDPHGFVWLSFDEGVLRDDFCLMRAEVELA